MENLPEYAGLLIGLTALLTIYFFLEVNPILKNFFMDRHRLARYSGNIGPFGLLPSIHRQAAEHASAGGPADVAYPWVIHSQKGRIFIDGLITARLTLVHSVAIFVEAVIYLLFLHRYVPRIMTFEGYNFDLFSGVTAPLVYYFGFVRMKLSRTVLIAWNLICLLLVTNAAALAVLSLPPGFRHIGAERPDIAIGVFPFTLLPAVIVPLVLFSHLGAIRHLIIQKK